MAARSPGPDGAGSTTIFWEVDFGSVVEALSDHECTHRHLNELTSFGAVLDAVSRLARDEPEDGRFARMFRKLVGRARTTHEVFATYASRYNNHGAMAKAELATDHDQFL